MTATNIYQALEEARAAFPPIVKNKTASIPTKGGGSYSYKYADLEGVLRAVEPVLRKHGLGVFQQIHNGLLVTEVRLVESSGGMPTASIHCDIPLPADVDPQRFGSAITYARRYGIVTLLGLVTETDDDGAAATHRPSEPQDPTAVPRPRRSRRESLVPDGSPATDILDRSLGWEGPGQRAAEHDRLAERVKTFEPEQQDELRKLSVELGGFPLPKDKFDELERAADLVRGCT